MPTLQFITGSGSGSTVAQGVVGQIAALNQTIANLNSVYFQYYSTGATTNNSVSFYLNGKLTTIANCDPTLTLVDYLRYQTPFKGVKQHCRQGGCGVCAVMISYYDRDTASFRNLSINSCLKLVVQCDGHAIWTTEGIKPSKTQYHSVQERISKTYGIQCGACTTAQVMSQYTALQPGTFMQKAQIEFLEKNFDGNLCRCSCYPGILAMARSFLPSGPNCPQVYSTTGSLLGWDLNALGPSTATGTVDDGGFYSYLGQYATGAIGVNNLFSYNQLNPKGFVNYNPALDKNATSNATISSYLQNFTPVAGTYTNTLKGVTYARVTSLASLISQIQIAGTNNCKIVAAGTSYGVPEYARPDTNLFLDVNYIPELHATRVTSTGAVFGANVAINKAVMLMYTGASSDTKFNDIADHLFYISGNHVRNVASICGGLVMSKNGGFASDVAPLMIAANATLNCTYIYGGYTIDAVLTIQDYLNLSTTDGKFILIKSIVIPAKATGEVFWSYRVAQRYFNSHAWLNCAASYKVTANVISNARVAYGGLVGGVGVARASLTEAYLNGKDISSASSGLTGALNTIISGAITNIQSDLNTIVSPLTAFVDSYGQDGKVAFRKNLGTTLFYISFLNLLKNQGYLTNYSSVQNALETWISGAADSTRVPEVIYQYLSQTLRAEYPIHYSIPRIDALQIAAGEAKYNDDVPSQPDQLWIASALSTIAVGAIDWDSPTTQASLAAARATPGVEYVITAQDLYAAVKEISLAQLANFNGYSAANASNWTGANQNANLMFKEFLGDQFISHIGQRIALVLSKDSEIAKKAARAITFGYKNVYTNYAVNVVDAVNKEIALNGSTINNVGTYMLTHSSVANGINFKNTYARGAILPALVLPATGGLTAPFELQDGFISVSATGTNLIPPSSTTATFTGSDGTTYDSLYYTGPNGQIAPWSQYILLSTGAYSPDKFQIPLERRTTNCYLDEFGVYQIYSAVQMPQQVTDSIVTGLGIPKTKVNLKVRRIGGGFGQKLAWGSGEIPVLSVLACYVAEGRMVRFVPELDEEMITSGGESETWCPYRIGFNQSGALNSVNMSMYVSSVYGINPTWLTNITTTNPTGYRGTPRDVSIQFLDVPKSGMKYFQNIPSSYLDANICKVPRPPRSPYRGPYFGNWIYTWGCMIDDIAGYLNKSFTDVAYLNAPQSVYAEKSTAPPTNTDRYEWRNMMDRLEAKYDYSGKKAAVDAFNAANKYIKRSVELFYGRYDTIYYPLPLSTDPVIRITPQGDVLVWTGHPEIGQGGDVKIIQLISSKLKCPTSMVRIVECNDNTLQWGFNLAGASAGTTMALTAVDNLCNKFLDQAYQVNLLTGGVGGSDLYVYNTFNSGNAITPARDSSAASYKNLSAAMTGNNGVGDVTAWKALVTSMSTSYFWLQTGPTSGSQLIYPSANAYVANATSAANDLIFQGSNSVLRSLVYTGTVSPTSYQAYIASMSTVEVNILTGNVRILETNIMADCGDAINPSVDQGQLYGGYIFGLGAAFKEERPYATNMTTQVVDTWDYKPPCVVDIPQVFNVDFYGNTGAYTDINNRIFLDGKAFNECSQQSVYASFFAVKSAIRSFRKQQGLSGVFTLQQPATPDRIQAAAGFTPSMLNVNPL